MTIILPRLKLAGRLGIYYTIIANVSIRSFHNAQWAPARNGVDDPLAELERLIGCYEASGTIVHNPVPQARPVQSSLTQARPEWDHGCTHAASSDQAKLSGPYDVGQSMPPNDNGRGCSDVLPKPRRGLWVAVVVISCALVGSASAFGYWLWAGGNDEPRPMTAEAAPNDVARPIQDGDSRSNKPFDGRLSGQGPDAVDPVSSPNQAPAEYTPTNSRQIVPSAGTIYGPETSRQGIPPAGIVYGATPTTESAPPVVLSNTARKHDSGGPAPVVLAAQPARQPNSEVQSGSRAMPATSYVVQLSSQRSEKAGLATSRVLKTKYPNVFGSWQPFIHRSDLVDRGV
jgi:hypothetical protein